MKYMKKKLIIKTDYGDFSCIFEPEPDMGGYIVTAPKKPGVVTWGKNLIHAKKMAKEAIECVVEGGILIAVEKAGTIIIKKQKFVA